MMVVTPVLTLDGDGDYLCEDFYLCGTGFSWIALPNMKLPKKIRLHIKPTPNGKWRIKYEDFGPVVSIGNKQVGLASLAEVWWLQRLPEQCRFDLEMEIVEPTN